MNSFPTRFRLRAGFLAMISVYLQLLCWSSYIIFVEGKQDFLSEDVRNLFVTNACWPFFAASLEDSWCVGLWIVAILVALFSMIWASLEFDPDVEGHHTSERRIFLILLYLSIDISCLISAWVLFDAMSQARS